MIQNTYIKAFLGIFLGIIGSALLVYLNFQVMSGWFGKTGPANLGSIEVSYVTMGRFLVDYGLPFFGNASWLPTWYMGFPMHVFYTPILPILEYLLNQVSGLGLWESYRLITGVSYILAPVSVFFFGWVLSKRFLGGLISGLLYSFGPSIFYLLVPEVYTDRISTDFADPRRFTILVRWGEGPHTLGLALVPLVGLFFVKYLRSQKVWYFILACVFMGLTALSNSLGLFSAILLTLSITFIFFAQSKGIVRKLGILAFVLLGVISLALVSFWFNIQFITTFFAEGEGSFGKYWNLFPWGWLGVFGGILVLYIFFSKVVKDLGIGSTLLWFLMVFGIVGTYYYSGDEKFELLPQALRYNTEVDMALSLLIGTTFGTILRFFDKRFRAVGIGLSAVGILTTLVLIIYGVGSFASAKKATQISLDVNKTRERELADWLEKSTDQSKGDRVLVPGNYAFYLNYFNNVNQVRGGIFQAETNPWGEHAYFYLSNGKDKELTEAWLKILGIKYFVVPTHGSSELYKDFKNVEKFEGMEVASSEKGDIIYKIPDSDSAVVKIVDGIRVKSLKKPRKADDKSAILSYADWISEDKSKEGSLRMVNNSHYVVSGSIISDGGILVRMTYDPGWTASGKINGKSVNFKVKEDPLGFIYIIPEQRAEGSFEISLKHEPSKVVWLGYLTTLFTIVGGVVYIIKTLARHPSLRKG